MKVCSVQFRSSNYTYEYQHEEPDLKVGDWVVVKVRGFFDCAKVVNPDKVKDYEGDLKWIVQKVDTFRYDMREKVDGQSS
jgi:hypothetical protein